MGEKLCLVANILESGKTQGYLTATPEDRERKVDARGMVQKGKQNENGSLQEEGKTKGQRLEGWGPEGLVKMGSRPHKGVTVLCRSWCGVPDELQKLDSYLFYTFQLIYYGVYDHTLYSAASETTGGGGKPSQPSVVNFNYFLATANLSPTQFVEHLTNAFVEQTLGFLEFYNQDAYCPHFNKKYISKKIFKGL